VQYLTTLYVTDHRARVGVKGGSLIVSSGDGIRSRVPIEAIEAVVIVGHAQVTSDALALCTERHVRVTALRGSGSVRFAIGGGVGGNVLLRVAQHRAADDDGRAQAIARIIVVGKLQNAQRMLHRWSWDAGIGPRRVLRSLMARVEAAAEQAVGAEGGDRIRGFEGDGARAYFEGMRLHLAGARWPTTLKHGLAGHRETRSMPRWALFMD
jgi:CRISPR-associated protein Cas1